MKKIFNFIIKLHSIIVNVQIKIHQKLNQIINQNTNDNEKFFPLENQLEKYAQEYKIEKNLDIDTEFYKWNYPDLNGMTLEQAEEHYYEHGYYEGRLSSKFSIRKFFLEEIYKGNNNLEIGPFNNPVLRSSKVKYFDVLSSEKLIDRAKNLSMDISNIPSKIHFVDKFGDLKTINEKFENVFSSHCIEHQPNLVKHLNDVSSLLSNNGRYFLIIPNKNYIFDRSLPETLISEILESHYNNNKKHTLNSVIKNFALTTHNDTKDHWLSQDIDGLRKKSYIKDKEIKTDIDKITNSIKMYNASKNDYIDVHAWHFSPKSFKKIINILIKMKLISFAKSKVYGPNHGSCEFHAILEK